MLLDKLKALGVDRSRLPENLSEFFGMFGSERQNVIKACDIVRRSPLIGPKIPVHGLMLDIGTGKLEWMVNGYQTLETAASQPVQPADSIGSAQPSVGSFNVGEMKFPETKIGETVTKAADWLSRKSGEIGAKAQEKLLEAPPAAAPVEQVVRQVTAFAEKNWPRPSAAPPPGLPPKIPVPPPIRPRVVPPRVRR